MGRLKVDIAGACKVAPPLIISHADDDIRLLFLLVSLMRVFLSHHWLENEGH